MSYDSYMRDRMSELLTRLSHMDISQAPNYIMMVRMCDRLKDEGVSHDVAEKMVARMEIEISENAAQDQELMNQVLDTYGPLVKAMLIQIRKDFKTNPEEVLLSMARQFKITMDF